MKFNSQSLHEPEKHHFLLAGQKNPLPKLLRGQNKLGQSNGTPPLSHTTELLAQNTVCQAYL